jgi:hypothetical protein
LTVDGIVVGCEIVDGVEAPVVLGAATDEVTDDEATDDDVAEKSVRPLSSTV